MRKQVKTEVFAAKQDRQIHVAQYNPQKARCVQSRDGGLRAENLFARVALALGLGLLFFFYLRIPRMHPVYLFTGKSLYIPTWSATKKTTSREEARNPTTPAPGQCPAAMKKQAQARRGLRIKPHAGTWVTATLSGALESD